MSVKGPTFWKNIPINSGEMQENVTVFKNSIRKNFLELGNEISHF